MAGARDEGPHGPVSLRYSAMRADCGADALLLAVSWDFAVLEAVEACTLWVRGDRGAREDVKEGTAAQRPSPLSVFEGEERPGSGRLRVTTPSKNQDWSALRDEA